MKKLRKELLAGALALSMMGTMTSALAANTVEIVGIKVLEGTNGETKEVSTYAPDAQDIALTSTQMLEVKMKVEDEEKNAVKAAGVSFVSNCVNSEFGNSTVQYVTQKKTGDDGTVTVRFRPRASVGTGSFIAKSGATEVSIPATFKYTVAETANSMSLVGRRTAIQTTSDNDAVFVIKGFNGTSYAGFKVSLDSTELAAGKYTIALDGADLVLTIKNSNLKDKAAGDKIQVTVTHDGYQSAKGEIEIVSSETYTVTLERNGGTIADGKDVTEYEYGKGVTLPTGAEITKAHYVFDGWYESEKFEGEAVKAVSPTAAGAKTYYAKWTPETYNVTLELNGGSFVAEGKNVTEYTYGTGAALPKKEDITKEGLYFAGWYNSDGKKVSNISKTDFGDKTYYAHWSENAPAEYTITFVDDNGDVLKEITVMEDETPEYDGTTPTKEPDEENRYEFEGWTPEIAEATENATYTAVYKAIPRVYIKVNGEYKDKVKIEVVNGEWIINAPDEVLSNLVMYKATYTSGALTKLKIIKVSNKITADNLKLGANDKLFLWDKDMIPVIDVQTNNN